MDVLSASAGTHTCRGVRAPGAASDQLGARLVGDRSERAGGVPFANASGTPPDGARSSLLLGEELIEALAGLGEDFGCLLHLILGAGSGDLPGRRTDADNAIAEVGEAR